VYDLYALFKEPNIVQSIKINGVRCLGHNLRMNQVSLFKKLIFFQPEGSRKEEQN
jgi:hypothetical protein